MVTELLGMSAAAARLGIHVWTLRVWCESGRIDPIRDSAGRRLFPAEVIDRLAREREAAKARQEAVR